MRNRILGLLVAIPVLIIVGAFVYNLPPVNERLAWRVDAIRARIKYAISPPEEVVFVPQDQQAQVAEIVETTLQALTPTAVSSPTPTPTATQPGPSPTPNPTSTPSPTSTAIPSQVELSGFRHEYQQWNNCGPANLSMALSFWGWAGDQRDTAAYLKPNQRDKNVMPYEMANFIESETDFQVAVRVGGDLETIKRFVAAGFPVVLEKGFEEPGFDGWMGHYEVVLGYDDQDQSLTVHDSFIGPGVPFKVPIPKVEEFWRSFNNAYLVIYPTEREAEAMEILGPHADETTNFQLAAQRASDEIFSLSERDQAFAWFNRGSNLVELQDYAGAAAAYDEYFALYVKLPVAERPWRMMWYQTGPYWAYYYTGRYYDVINLATATLDAMSEPVLEESYYWRGLAKEALGDIDGAVADLQETLRLNANFGPGEFHLNRILTGS
jgi:tetratricopeptide (TPR) repeat protein